MNQKSINYLIQIVVLAGTYVVTDKLGQTMAFTSGKITLVWPPTGIALAALLIFGYRLWPGIALGAFLANVSTGAPLVFTVIVTIGNTLTALSGVYLLRRFSGFQNSIDRVKKLLGLLFWGGLISTMLSATIGVGGVCASGLAPWSVYGVAWAAWWLGDVMGVLVITPMLLSWATPLPKKFPFKRLLEMVILLAAVAGIEQLVFGRWSENNAANYPLAYLTFPLIIWAAFRFGQRGTTATSGLIIGMALWGTLNGYGPFARPLTAESMVLLWIFMGAIAITATVMAALITEQRLTEKELQKERDFAMRVMNALGQGVVVTNSNRKFEYVNPACTQILGYKPNEILSKSPEDFVIPPDHDALQQAFNERLFGKTSTYPLRLRHKNGRILHVLLTGTPRYEQGQLNGSIVVFTDLTEQEQSRQALRESEARNRALLNAIPDLIFLQDKTGVYTDYHTSNPNLLLAPPGQLLGKNMRDVLPPELYQLAQKHFDQALETGQSQLFEYPLLLKGQHHFFEARLQQYGHNRILSIIRDVTDRRQAETQFKQLQERFTKAFQANPSAISITTFVEGIFVDVNPRFSEVFGYDRDELIGHSILDLGMLSVSTSRSLLTQTLLKKGKLHNVELQLRAKNGQIRHTLAAMELIELNNQPHILTMFYDITGRITAEAALRQSEEQYRLLFQNSPVGIFHYNRDLHITQLNDRFTSIIRSPRNVLMGLNLKTLQDSRIIPALAAALDGEEGLYEGIYHTTTSQVVIHISMRSAPFYDEHHQVKGGVAIVEDITERVQAEAALRDSEERFRQVIASISDCLYMAEIQADGVYKNLYLSPNFAHLTGYPVQRFMDDGSLWPTLIHPDDRQLAAEQVQRFRAGHASEVEYRITTTNGQLIWVRDSGRVEKKSHSVIVYSVISNITERKQLEAQLQQSQKLEAIGRLAGGIAHDFNNILTVIIGNAELLLDTLPEDTPIRWEIDQINKVGNRAASLTRQLLAFSRQQILTPAIINLNTAVAEMDQMLRRLIGEDISFTTIFEPELGKIKADPGQIEQVILNLAVNARDAMPNGGKLTITTANTILTSEHARHRLGALPGPHVMLAVSDTGIGMDDETKAHIFEPFFTTKEQGKGTGLGLATIHGIVAQSGGHIRVNSQPGQGTTFKVYFPQIQPHPEPDPKLPAVVLPARQPATILLVEDEDVVRSVTGRTLAKEGYTVLEASHSAAAIEIAREYTLPIHLLLTDIVMPGGMNGYELAKFLTGLRPHIEVLYMSGYTDYARPESEGRFLQKPFPPQTLLQKVRDLLTPKTELPPPHTTTPKN